MPQLYLSFPDPATKRCCHCKEVKPRRDFPRHPQKKDGLNPACKLCVNARQRSYATHPDFKVKKRAWSEAHQEQMREYRRAWKRRNPEKAVEWDKLNAVQRRQHRAKWRALNPEENKACQYRYRIKPEARRRQCEHQSRRRAQKLRTQTCRVNYQKIWERDKGVCYLCGTEVERSKVHFDHVIPLVKDGAHTPDNIRVSHQRCNQRKGRKLLTEILKP